ncbi:unnamed protein product, partial [Mesorhabditis belari]|uniref:Sulfotransferase n=1 Tax=Mesorhabditis belari TaxID=2138241 RepID=A0AAF3EPM2_9BILA
MFFRNRSFFYAFVPTIIIFLIIFWPDYDKEKIVKASDTAKLFFKKFLERFSVNEKHLTVLLVVVTEMADEDIQRAMNFLEWLCPSRDQCSLQTPFYQMISQYRVSKRHRLTACTIYKNMSTLLTAIMCYLHNPFLIKTAGNFRNQWNDNRSCIGKNEFFKHRQVEKFLQIPFDESKNFALVREPMERFLSGLVNQCTNLKRCGDCVNADCLLGMLEKNGRETVRRDDFKMGNGGYSIDEHVNLHFLPQLWQCEFSSQLSNYKILKYSSADTEGIARQLEELFGKAGVNGQEIDFIKEQLQGGRSLHSTVGDEKRKAIEEELKESPVLMKRFMGLFFFDYLLLVSLLPPIVRIDRSDIIQFLNLIQKNRKQTAIRPSTVKLWRSTSSMIFQLEQLKKAGYMK